jgi:hypothetical protein
VCRSFVLNVVLGCSFLPCSHAILRASVCQTSPTIANQPSEPLLQAFSTY